MNEKLVWDHPTGHPEVWVADVGGVGRYLVRKDDRTRRTLRANWIVLLNGQRTALGPYSTDAGAKLAVEERVATAREIASGYGAGHEQVLGELVDVMAVAARQHWLTMRGARQIHAIVRDGLQIEVALNVEGGAPVTYVVNFRRDA